MEAPDGEALTLMTPQRLNSDIAPFAEDEFDLYSDLMDDQYLPPLSRMNVNVSKATSDKQAEQRLERRIRKLTPHEVFLERIRSRVLQAILDNCCLHVNDFSLQHTRWESSGGEVVL